METGFQNYRQVPNGAFQMTPKIPPMASDHPNVGAGADVLHCVLVSSLKVHNDRHLVTSTRPPKLYYRCSLI